MEESAFLQIYETHIERIFRYCAYRTHHRETAEDLTSQIFVKAFEHARRFDPTKASATTWLYAIARNVVIDHWRKVKPSSPIEDAEPIASTHDVVKDVADRQMAEQVRRILETLTPAQHDIVLLRLWDDLSYADIAEIVGKSEAACKMTYSRAIASLREQFGPIALILLLIMKYPL